MPCVTFLVKNGIIRQLFWQVTQSLTEISQTSVDSRVLTLERIFLAPMLTWSAELIRCPPVVCPSSVRQTFFNSHKLPQFLSDLSDIWLVYSQQYCPQTCAIIILIFLLRCFFTNLSLSNKAQNCIFYRCLAILLCDHATWFIGISDVLSGV